MALRTIEIPDFIKKIVLSNSRRAVYYKEGSNIPKKYAGHEFDKKGRLLDKDGKPIIKNYRSVGKPRYKTINGQELYSGLTMPFVRSTMVKQIKDSYSRHLKGIKPLDMDNFPIKITIELHDVTKDGNWDLDNKWIYTKCLLDALKAHGIIPDDSIKYITHSPGFEYHPIKEGETPKLVVRIYQDKREELQHVQLYHELYSSSEEW